MRETPLQLQPVQLRHGHVWNQTGVDVASPDASINASEPMAKVEYAPPDLLRLIKRNLIPLNTMMERAGLSEIDIYNRIRDVFHHFKLPYDAEPPGE